MERHRKHGGFLNATREMETSDRPESAGVSYSRAEVTRGGTLIRGRGGPYHADTHEQCLEACRAWVAEVERHMLSIGSHVGGFSARRGRGVIRDEY